MSSSKTQWKLWGNNLDIPLPTCCSGGDSSPQATYWNHQWGRGPRHPEPTQRKPGCCQGVAAHRRSCSCMWTGQYLLLPLPAVEAASVAAHTFQKQQGTNTKPYEFNRKPTSGYTLLDTYNGIYRQWCWIDFSYLFLTTPWRTSITFRSGCYMWVESEITTAIEITVQ